MSHRARMYGWTGCPAAVACLHYLAERPGRVTALCRACSEVAVRLTIELGGTTATVEYHALGNPPALMLDAVRAAYRRRRDPPGITSPAKDPWGLTRWRLCETAPVDPDDDEPVYSGMVHSPDGAWVRWEEARDVLRRLSSKLTLAKIDRARLDQLELEAGSRETLATVRAALRKAVDRARSADAELDRARPVLLALAAIPAESIDWHGASPGPMWEPLRAAERARRGLAPPPSELGSVGGRGQR